MVFLPQNFKRPSKKEQFMRFESGQNTFRILSPLVEGFQVFDKSNKPHNKKIVRDEQGNIAKDSYFGKEELEAIDARKKETIDKDGNKSEGAYDVRYFWQVFVWNWKESKFQCLVITQGGVIDSIKGILQTENPKKKGDFPFSDPTQYDFIVTKIGEGLGTSYQVGKMDKEPMPQDILDTWLGMTYDAAAVFKGTYPFEL